MLLSELDLGNWLTFQHVFFCLVFVRNYEDSDSLFPVALKDCDACLWDAEVDFWKRREYRAARYDVVFDTMEAAKAVEWAGDRVKDYSLPIAVGSPFVRGDYLKKKTLKVVDLVESGGGEVHKCRYGRMPKTAEIGAFMVRGAERIPTELNGFIWVRLKITMVGSVNQRPGGRWEWVGRKKFRLDLPPPMAGILGPFLDFDGFFRIYGEAASRGKWNKTQFIEADPGLLMSKLPRGTTVKFEWGDCLFPTPCYGVMIWGVYAELLEWRVLKDQPLPEFLPNVNQLHQPPGYKRH